MHKVYIGRCLIGELFDKHVLDDCFDETQDIERDGLKYQVQATKYYQTLFGEKTYTMFGSFSIIDENRKYQFRYKGPANEKFDDAFLENTNSVEID